MTPPPSRLILPCGACLQIFISDVIFVLIDLWENGGNFYDRRRDVFWHCSSVRSEDATILLSVDPLYTACLGGAVGSVTLRAAWLRWSASPGSSLGLARSLCQVIAAYALRLYSRAGTEGSTVSSLICDRWLILGSETLSISRCLNHW